jgi:hypothetical protein
MSEKEKALSDIENAMERWHHGRDNDDETLNKIDSILKNIGMLAWFKDEP